MNDFIYVQPQIYTKSNGDWGTSYNTDYHRCATLKEAINYGWRTLDHDDFWVCEISKKNGLVQIYHSDGKKRPIVDDDDRAEFSEVEENLL